MDIEKLNDIAEEILKENPKASLSGSLALHNWGIKLPRVPGDIDIFIPHGQKFQKLEGMWNSFYVMDEDYENEYYERLQYEYKGVKCDIFMPIDDNGDLIYGICEGMNTIVPHEIIGLKAHHAMGDSESNEKHRRDIQFIIGHLKERK